MNVMFQGILGIEAREILTHPMVSLAASVVALLAIILFIRMWIVKRKVEKAAEKVITMSKDAMSLSELPISSAVVGGYKLVEKLSEGATSLTYLAKDDSDYVFAIKMPTPRLLEDEEFIARFLREAEILNNLSHPNIVKFHGCGTVRDRNRKIPYMVLEFLGGQNLSEIVRKEAPLPIPRVVKVLDDVAYGLSAVHEKNVVHRNIKPDSVRVTPDGKVKVFNFGVAYAGDLKRMTQAGQVVGTAQYMSPEQLAGKQVDPQADLYALGVVGFEMLTGRLPFEEVNVAQLALRKMQEDPPRVSTLRGDVPPALDEILTRLMSRDVAKRFPSAKALSDALKKVYASLPQ
jgi:serine/threonine-protein kinase